MKIKTEDQLLTEYIEKYYTGVEVDKKIIAGTYGFAYYKVDFHSGILGDTLITEVTISVDKAKKAFKNLANKLKSL